MAKIKVEGNSEDRFFSTLMDLFETIIFIAIILYLIQLLVSWYQQISTGIIGERNVLLEATLTGSILPNKLIKFYYRSSGSSSWNYLGETYTNEEGKASLTIIIPRGIYDFRAVFEGDEIYEESYDEKLNISI